MTSSFDDTAPFGPVSLDEVVTPDHTNGKSSISALEWDLIRDRAADVIGDVTYEEINSITGGSDKALTEILRRVHCLSPSEYAILDHEKRNIVLFMAVTALGEPCVQVRIQNLGHYFREATEHRRSVG